MNTPSDSSDNWAILGLYSRNGRTSSMDACYSSLYRHETCSLQRKERQQCQLMLSECALHQSEHNWYMCSAFMQQFNLHVTEWDKHVHDVTFINAQSSVTTQADHNKERVSLAHQLQAQAQAGSRLSYQHRVDHSCHSPHSSYADMLAKVWVANREWVACKGSA